MNSRQKTKKNQPKNHTKQFELHIVEGDDKLLIEPTDDKAYKHYKRWAYQNLNKRNVYYDKIADLYVIDLAKSDKTIGGELIIDALRSAFTILNYLPFED